MTDEEIKVTVDLMTAVKDMIKAGGISDRDVRYTVASHLRMLLHKSDKHEQGLLIKVVNTLRLDFKVPSLEDLDTTIETADLAFSSGYKDGSMQIAGLKTYNRALSAEEIKQMWSLHKFPIRKILNLNNFLSGKVIKINGEYFSRIEVIKMVANKKGANHLDLNLTGRNKILNEIAHEQIHIGGSSALLNALKSITQDLVNTKYYDQTLKKLRTL